MAEDEMLDGITDSVDVGFGKALGHGEGQGSLVCSSPCCSPRGHKEVDTTE